MAQPGAGGKPVTNDKERKRQAQRAKERAAAEAAQQAAEGQGSGHAQHGAPQALQRQSLGGTVTPIAPHVDSRADVVGKSLSSLHDNPAETVHRTERLAQEERK